MKHKKIYTVVIEEIHKERYSVSSAVMCNCFSLQDAIDRCNRVKIPPESKWSASFKICCQTDPESGSDPLVGFRDGELVYYRNGGKRLIDEVLEEEAGEREA